MPIEVCVHFWRKARQGSRPKKEEFNTEHIRSRLRKQFICPLRAAEVNAILLSGRGAS